MNHIHIYVLDARIFSLLHGLPNGDALFIQLMFKLVLCYSAGLNQSGERLFVLKVLSQMIDMHDEDLELAFIHLLHNP